MAWYNLRSGDRDFIHQENKRIIDSMNANAEYLATNQTLEAAKSRMNDARIAMELEDDPAKKARLRALANQYAREVLDIQNAWESEVKASNRWERRRILLGWLPFLVFFSFFFPFNLIILALFALWWYRHYVVLRAEYHMTEEAVQTAGDDQAKMAQIERVNQTKDALVQALNDWVETLSQEEAAAISAGKSQWTMSEAARATGQALVQQQQAFLEDLAQIADFADITEAYQDHQELIQLIQEQLDQSFVFNLLVEEEE